MPLTVVVGAQWGDEGKGRIVDALAADAAAVARFQGGPNAGHTVYLGKEKFIFHLIPLGIFNPGALCCIGLGVALDPLILCQEIKDLERRGYSVISRILIDPRCHLITPDHIDRDRQMEAQRSEGKIGTTLRGIGPTFSDRASRTGIRLGAYIEKLERGDDVPFKGAFADACLCLKQYIGDVSLTLYRMLKQGKNVLAEGGQGTMLDLGLGTYPYVTASNTIAASAPMNLGLGPKSVDKVIAVMKAYTTRVGEGPFPTEISGGLAEQIRQTGDEYGATTGRPRRCGWFDGVVAKFAARVNGVDRWALTKLDVLDQLDTIKIAVAYQIEGEITEELPNNTIMLSRAQPIYREFPGWKRSTRAARKLQDLPPQTRAYLDFIEDFTGLGFQIVSIGYERKCMIML